MNSESSNTTNASDPIHCRYLSPSGRRCRQAVANVVSGLCFRHATQQQKERDIADIASTLTGRPKDFKSATRINRSLGELYNLLAQHRISPRHAAVLAYISNLLLRSLSAIDRENNVETVPQIIVDIPRPIRDPKPEVKPS
jgi:hypothetical protein